MEKQAPLLPRLAHKIGKGITHSAIITGAAAKTLAKSSAHLAGQCAREFIDGLKEGRQITAPRAEPANREAVSQP